MTYPHRYYLICPAVAAPAIRQLFAIRYGISGFQELRSELSAASDPTGPVTWYAASIVTTEDERLALLRIEQDGSFSGGAVYYLRCDSATGVVVTTNCPHWSGLVGQVADFDAAIALLGLARHRAAGGP